MTLEILLDKIKRAKKAGYPLDGYKETVEAFDKLFNYYLDSKGTVGEFHLWQQIKKELGL